MNAELRFRFWAPLLNFDSDSPEIELAGNTLIRELSTYEKQHIETLRKVWAEVGYQKFGMECFVTKQEPEPKPGLYIDDGRACLEKALTMLRLFKEEIVGFKLIVQPLSEEEHYGATAQYFRHYELWLGKEGEQFRQKYKILNTQIEIFQTFFLDFYRLNFEPFNLAVDYFNKSYMEPYARDSLIDLVICLENLYLRKEDPELKGYKLRLRASHILTTKFEERKNIFDDLKKAYNTRSQIVHGDTIPNVDYSFLFKIRHYARESIKMFLKRPQLVDTNFMDEIILGATKD